VITLHITIATAIFSVMFAYRNLWQIRQANVLNWIVEEIGEEPRLEIKYYKAKWHKWQFALQIYIGVIITFVSFACDYSLINSFGHGLLFGSVFWLIFDTLLGYLLTKNLLHVDSNGIGTIYKNLFKSFAPHALLISKVLFFTISIILSLI
jgi:hypothetical protein